MIGDHKPNLFGTLINVHIFQAVSTALGTGKLKYFNKEEALLQKDIEQADFDMLLVNLRMDSMYVKENMRIRWSSETGIVENILGVVKEYKETRGLLVSCDQCFISTCIHVCDTFPKAATACETSL